MCDISLPYPHTHLLMFLRCPSLQYMTPKPGPRLLGQLMRFAHPLLFFDHASAY